MMNKKLKAILKKEKERRKAIEDKKIILKDGNSKIQHA